MTVKLDDELAVALRGAAVKFLERYCKVCAALCLDSMRGLMRAGLELDEDSDLEWFSAAFKALGAEALEMPLADVSIEQLRIMRDSVATEFHTMKH